MSKRMSDIVQQLRDRACPAGLPHTGENPEDDHGHTDCWLHHQAADEIERLRQGLWDCAGAAGVDPNSDTTHPDPVKYALAAVHELAGCYDNALMELNDELPSH